MSLAAELVSLSGSFLEEQCANYSLSKMEAGSIINATSNIQPTSRINSLAEDPLPLTKLMLNYFQEPSKSFDASLDYYFSDFWQSNGDERTSKLPFMAAGPWKLIYATIIYLYLIKRFLPDLMRNRKAFELNWPIRIYNLLMVFSNFYAFYHGARILSFGTKCFGCQIVDGKDYSASGMELLHYGWLFVMSRLVEWLDTVFFVLRKKDKQVTKLHVFHHSFVPIFCWVYLKFLPGYWTAFFPFINTFVHTIMYSYYFLATFGAPMQPYLWWKKYLTSLQIAQFVMILIQLFSIPLSTSESCQMPQSFFLVALAGAFLFLWLFYTYYKETYTKRSDGIQTERVASSKHKHHSASNTNQSQQALTKFRVEGSSTALADSIDNAIVSEGDINHASKRLSEANWKKLV